MFHFPADVRWRVIYFGLTLVVSEETGVPEMTLVPGENKYRSYTGPSYTTLI